MIGENILGYTVDEKIGSGASGTVYKVSKSNVSGTYTRALKHVTIPTKNQYMDVRNSMGGDIVKTDNYFAEVLRRVTEEIQIISQLSETGCKNIVRYFENDIVEHNAPKIYDIYILMEYLTPFNDFVFENELKISDVIRLGKDILNALILCHSKNIIHRDIKDDNIFVGPDNSYKLGDFGVSKMLNDRSRAESMKGTPNYIAPEVYLGKEKYDNTVDLYSLGIVMYRLLNRMRFPFLPAFPESYDSNDEEIAFEKRMKGEIPELPFDAKNKLGEVVLKSIMPRSDRFNSAEEFLCELENAEKTLSQYELNITVNSVMPKMKNEDTEGAFGEADKREPTMDPAMQVDQNDLTIDAYGRTDLDKKTDKPIVENENLYSNKMSGSPFANGLGDFEGKKEEKEEKKEKKEKKEEKEKPEKLEKCVEEDIGNYNDIFIPSHSDKYKTPIVDDKEDFIGVRKQAEPYRAESTVKKSNQWLIYLIPVAIALVYVLTYLIIIPKSYESTVSAIEWLFSNPSKIVEELKDPYTVLTPIYKVYALKLFNWLLSAGFVVSLFFVGRTIQNKKPSVNPNAVLTGKAPYIQSIEIVENIKQIKTTEAQRVLPFVKRVSDRLKNESEFGIGDSAVIRNEEEIASLLDDIQYDIDALQNEILAEETSAKIISCCKKIETKLKTRVELKKK